MMDSVVALMKGPPKTQKRRRHQARLSTVLVEILSGEDKFELLNKLLLFATRQGFEDPQEFVNVAIFKVLEGTRKLNPHFSVTENLLYAIASIAKNESKKNRRLDQLDGEIAVSKLSPEWSFLHPSLTPADILEAAEAKTEFAEDVIARATDLDASLGRILESALRLGWKPLEIAAELNIPVSKVYSGKRRLYRNRATLLQKPQTGGA